MRAAQVDWDDWLSAKYPTFLQAQPISSTMQFMLLLISLLLEAGFFLRFLF